MTKKEIEAERARILLEMEKLKLAFSELRLRENEALDTPETTLIKWGIEDSKKKIELLEECYEMHLREVEDEKKEVS